MSAAALAAAGLAFAGTAQAADPAIDLGTAKAFSVLGASGVTNTGVTTLSGNIGSYATPTITTDTTFVFSGVGTTHAGDPVAQQAQEDLLVAYNAAAAAGPPTAVPAELTRILPYLPGVYKADTSMMLSGAMTLDGGGRNDGVFVFQAPSTLITASNSSVLFVNGAQPCNVYWQVGSSATFGTDTDFVGNVLAHTSITANTTATFKGRLLADEGAVTLDSNTFTDPACDTSTGTDVDTDGSDTGTDGSTTDADGSDTGTDAGTDTDTDASTDADAGTDADADAGTDAGTDTDSGTDTDTDTDSGTDTDTDTDTDSDSSNSDISQNAAMDSDSENDANADVDSVDLSDSANLPDTGGSSGLLAPYGLIALAGGYVLLSMRPARRKHRG